MRDLARASGFSPTPQASGNPPASHSLLQLLLPRLHPQFLPNSTASVSHARPNCPPGSHFPKDRRPPPRPSQRPPRRLAPDQEEPASGVGWGRAGPIRPPLSAPAAPPQRPLCARGEPLCGALSAAPPWERERVKGSARAKQGTGGGQKATALTLGRFRHVAAFGLLVVSPLLPASPPRQGPERGGTGEERSRWDRVGNGASGAAGKGLKNCFGFAKDI